jgi:hypothetical protein
MQDFRSPVLERPSVEGVVFSFSFFGHPPCAPIGLSVKAWVSSFPRYHVCGSGLFYCSVSMFFFRKNRFDRVEILRLQIMAVLREARSPPRSKKMTARLVINDKENKRKRPGLVIIRNTLYLLSLYIYYLFFYFMTRACSKTPK